MGNSLRFLINAFQGRGSSAGDRIGTRGIPLLAIVLLCAAQTLLAAGTGTIKGKISDRDSRDALPGANVVVIGTGLGAATDLNGNYTIYNVPSGPQTVQISFVGYVSIKKQVTVREGQETMVDGALVAQVIEGQTIVVTGQAKGQMQAINQQLASDKIASIVSEAKIQELPDFNAAQAIGRLPGVSTVQSSGEASKVVIRGLAPQYNLVAVGGITLASTGSTQIGAASQGGTAGSLNNDRSVDLTMITPYMIKTVEVYKSLTPDMNANAIGGYVNMQLREAPDGFRTDLLAQTGYTAKSGKYGNYRFVAAGSDRFLDNALGVYVLGNAESYDRNADNMSASYENQNSVAQPDGYHPVDVTNVTLNRHLETRDRYGANLILDYRLPFGTLKSVNAVSRLASNAHDYWTIMDYKGGNINFRYREGKTNTDMAVNSLNFTNDFGFMSMDIIAGNTYSRNQAPGSPQYDFTQTNGIPGRTKTNTLPENLLSSVNFLGPAKTYLTNISLFSSDYKENDQVYKGEFKIPFNLEGITSGYFKTGGEFRYNYHTNEQGTPYAGIRPGSPISTALVNLISQNYHLTLDSAAGYFPGTNFTSNDTKLTDSFLDNRFGGVLWASNPSVLNGITDLLRNTPSINAVNSTGTNAGGWFESPYQYYPNKYKYIERYYAGFAMSELDVLENLMIVGGVRWEEVKGYYDAYNLSDGRDATHQVVDPVSAHPGNRYLLPMVQARWSVTDWADVRYSFTKTLARPDYSQLSPHFNMDYTQFNVWAGNPDLVPAEAVNHDVFLTFHSNELGLLSIGGFYKEVKNFAFYTQYKLHTAASPGLDSTGSFVVHTGSGVVSPKDGATLYTFMNSSKPAFIRGIEIDLQTRLWYLPEPLNGIILGINYTHIGSDATYPWRDDRTVITGPHSSKIVTVDSTRSGRLINQPNDVLNAYLGYDYQGFSGRLSFLFQGNSVNTIGAFTEQDGFTKDYFRIDASVRQKLPWTGFQLFLDVSNLNNRSNDASQASIGGFTSEQNYGLTANLGVRYTL